MTNKEYGSNFHLESRSEYFNSEEASFFSRSDLNFFLSGRAALYHLIKEGIKKYQWQRLYFPSYYCHEVITPLKNLEIDILFYDFNPFTGELNLDVVRDESASVFINVNYFNLVKIDSTRFNHLVEIDDLTYNVRGIKSSQADYSFGSLRKELPVTVGGFCSSSKKLTLPSSEATNAALLAHRDRLLAMSLKSRYLEHAVGDKNLFLKLFSESEIALDDDKTLCGMPQETKNLFAGLDVNRIFLKKSENVVTALNKLDQKDNVLVNLDKKENGFGLVFYFNTHEHRDRVRMHLIKNKIYPAILWPHQISAFAKHIEDRVLFVHIDYRYTQEDVEAIVYLLNKSL